MNAPQKDFDKKKWLQQAIHLNDKKNKNYK